MACKRSSAVLEKRFPKELDAVWLIRSQSIQIFTGLKCWVVPMVITLETYS